MRFIVKLAIFLFFVCDLSAQQLDMRFKHISISEGLSQICVNSIIQDKEGFIWIATHDGLNKYDGYTFKVYKPDAQNKYSLYNNQVKVIFEDKDGYIWVGTGGGGLSKFDKNTEKFTTYITNPNDKNAISSNDVYSIFEDSKGRFWIGTFGGGLNVMNKKTGTFRHYDNDPNQKNSISGEAIRVIVEDKNHDIWIGVDGGGLNKYNEKTDDFTSYRHNSADPNSLSNDIVMSILVDSDNHFWIGTYDGGLNDFDPETKKCVQYHHNTNPYSLSSETVWSSLKNNDSTIWFGTRGGGLVLFNKRDKTFHSFNYNPIDKYSISDDKVLSIMKDRSGLLWIGTENNGINIYDYQSSKFQLYKNEAQNVNSLSNNYAMAMKQQGNILWIATRGGGLNSLDIKTGAITRYQTHFSSKYDISQLLSIEFANNGKLWLGSDGNGLFLFDPKTLDIENFKYDRLTKKNQISNNAITGITKTSDSVIWITTWGGGLNKLNTITKKFSYFEIGYPENKNVGWCMYKDKKGMLWIGTNGKGLLQFNPQTLDEKFYKNERGNPLSLSNNVVHYITESYDGKMWIGTGGGGLNSFDRNSNTFATISKKEGLSNDMVLGICEDDKHTVWLSTSNGLSKWDPTSKQFTCFYEENGIQGNSFIERSCFKLSDGKLFYGGPKGLTAFYPDSISSNSFSPPVVINNLKIFNKSVKVDELINDNIVLTKPIFLTDTINLSYKQSVFSFEFAALDYVAPLKNKYQYKMDGFDEKWTEVDANQRFATYTNLSGGTYVFKVRASNSEGKWNNKGASICIIINPPFYKKKWFYALLFFVIIIFIFVYIRLREKQIIKKRELIELSERTKLLQVEAEKLKESEDKFRKMFQNHNAVMILIDPETGRIVDANASACSFYKYPHSVLCTLMIKDIYELENEVDYDLLRHSISQNQNKTIYTHKLGDGTKRTVEVDSAPLETKTEKFYFSIIYDITERKQAEDALLESYEFNESLLQTIPFGMQIVDEDATILFVSVKLRETFGTGAIGSKCWDVFCDHKKQCEQCPLKSNIKFGITTTTEAHDLMNGRIFQIYHTGMMYNRKKAVLEIFHDITDKKLAEKEAQEVSTRLALATQAGGVGVWDYDLVNNRLIWDNQMFSLYGIEPHEFGGDYKSWNCFVHPTDIEQFDKDFELAILGEKEFNTEFQIKLDNGIIKNVRSLAVVQFDENNYPIRMIGTNWDITESKQLELDLIKEKENAEAASVAKSDFLATMSHEIRTPLNGVIGFSDILMKTKLTAKQFEYMKNVHVSANSLLDLVNDILDFSKIEAGKLELNYEKIDLIELAENIMEIMKFKVSEKGIESLLNIKPDLPRFIVADPVRLRQVLINLLGNATKFTEKGEIELKIEAIAVAGVNDEMDFTFSVRDTGIGIPKNKQQSIFNSFSQADSSTTRKYGGTGLGLAISSNLVKKMGSHIEVQSQEWVGSCFFFTVRLGFEHGELTKDLTFDWIKKILVVDDNTTNRNIVEAMLKPYSIITEQAENGIIALEMIEKNNDYDVIILDYHMPYLDGLQVIRNIKTNDAIKNQTIIFLHSSSDDETVLTECRANNVHYIMQKPLRMAHLFSMFSKIKLGEDYEAESITETDSENEVVDTVRKYTILIVDDNQMNLNLASSLVNISLPGSEVIETKLGTQAQELYLKHKPDMVLMDIQMPIMNGYEAAHSIRITEQDRAKRVPIIALTAGTVAGEKERCIEAGMDDYLPKPLNSKLLFLAFEKYLNGNSSISMEQKAVIENFEVHFDKVSVMEKYDNDETFIETFIATAFETMPQYLYDLQDAIKQKDVKQIKFNAHSLKGMARSICFNIMTDCALKIEKFSESDSDDSMDKCWETFVQLLKEFDYLKNELEKKVN